MAQIKMQGISMDSRLERLEVLGTTGQVFQAPIDLLNRQLVHAVRRNNHRERRRMADAERIDLQRYGVGREPVSRDTLLDIIHRGGEPYGFGQYRIDREIERRGVIGAFAVGGRQ